MPYIACIISSIIPCYISVYSFIHTTKIWWYLLYMYSILFTQLLYTILYKIKELNIIENIDTNSSAHLQNKLPAYLLYKNLAK